MEIQKEGGPDMEIQEIVRQNFARWAEAVSTGDPKKVAELYAEGEYVFLPTMSQELLYGDIEKVVGYFDHFLAKCPKEKIRSEKVQRMGDLYYSHSGLYDFEVDGESGRKVVNAKFTFNWRKNPNETWIILTHNSGLLP